MVSLSNFSSNWKLTFDIIKDSLLSEEIRRKGNTKVISSTQNEVLVMESRKRNMYINSHIFDDHSKSSTCKDITCFHCNKLGHMMKE